jgi:hypothetical protein
MIGIAAKRGIKEIIPGNKSHRLLLVLLTLSKASRSKLFIDVAPEIPADRIRHIESDKTGRGGLNAHIISLLMNLGSHSKRTMMTGFRSHPLREMLPRFLFRAKQLLSFFLPAAAAVQLFSSLCFLVFSHKISPPFVFNRSSPLHRLNGETTLSGTNWFRT